MSEFCAARGLPVLLHQNSTSVGVHGAYVYPHEPEEVLQQCPLLVVAWAHGGLSRRVDHDRYHELIERVLGTYPRLHVDLSWVGYDNVVCRGGAVRPERLDVVERYADRVLIGSDLVGHFDKLDATMGRYRGLLDGLSEAARRQVAGGNAERLFFPGLARVVNAAHPLPVRRARLLGPGTR